MKYLFTAIATLLLSLPNAFAWDDDRIAYDIPFQTKEVPFYTFADFTPPVAVRDIIGNPVVVPCKGNREG